MNVTKQIGKATGVAVVRKKIMQPNGLRPCTYEENEKSWIKMKNKGEIEQIIFKKYIFIEI